MDEEKVSKIYDENGYLLEELAQRWRSGDWLNKRKNLYTYDEFGYEKELLRQKWDGQIWYDDEKRTYSNDDYHNLIEEERYEWNGYEWIPTEKRTNIFEEGYRTIKLFQIWDGAKWENDTRRHHIYDNNDNCIRELWEEWDGLYWVNVEKDTFMFDDNSNCYQELCHEWDGEYWQNSSKLTHTWRLVTNITERIIRLERYQLFQNYPNPFNPSTIISWQLAVGSMVELSVYNVLGEKVAILVSERMNPGDHIYQFDGKNLASGVYYYQLVAGEYREVKKMILLR